MCLEKMTLSSVRRSESKTRWAMAGFPLPDVPRYISDPFTAVNFFFFLIFFFAHCNYEHPNYI